MKIIETCPAYHGYIKNKKNCITGLKIYSSPIALTSGFAFRTSEIFVPWLNVLRFDLYELLNIQIQTGLTSIFHLYSISSFEQILGLKGCGVWTLERAISLVVFYGFMSGTYKEWLSTGSAIQEWV